MAVIMVQAGLEEEHNAQEKRSLAHLKSTLRSISESETPSSGHCLLFVQKAFKRMCGMRCERKSSKYMDLWFILPTSSVGERLLSVAGFDLTDRRKPILPTNIEFQLFLFFNRRLWGSKEVSELVN